MRKAPILNAATAYRIEAHTQPGGAGTSIIPPLRAKIKNYYMRQRRAPRRSIGPVGRYRG